MIIRMTTNNENDNQVLFDFMYVLPTYLHWEHDIFNTKSYEENVKLKTKVRKILSKPVKSITKKDKEVIYNAVMLEWNQWCAQHMNKRQDVYKALEGNFEVSISTRFTEKDEGNKVFYYFTKSGHKLRQ